MIISVKGGREIADGFYELPVSQTGEGTLGKRCAPIPLKPGEANVAQSESHRADLWMLSTSDDQGEKGPLDEYERIESGLRLIERSGDRYSAQIAEQIEAKGGRVITRVELQFEGRLRGSALLPACQRARWRYPVAVVVAPVAWAVDVVIYPVQAIVKMVIAVNSF